MTEELGAARFLEEVASEGRALMPNGVEIGRRFVPNDQFSGEGFDPEQAGRVLGLVVHLRDTDPDVISNPLLDLSVGVVLYEDATGSQMELEWMRGQPREGSEREAIPAMEAIGFNVTGTETSPLAPGELADGVVASRLEVTGRFRGDTNQVAMYYDTVAIAVDKLTILMATKYLFEPPSMDRVRGMASSFEQRARELLESTSIVE